MKFKEFTRKYRGVWLILLVAMVVSVMYPFMAAGEFIGEVQSSETVYRHGLFGPAVERVTLTDGAVTYTTRYPWYYFWKHSDQAMADTLNIYGIECAGSDVLGDRVYIICYTDEERIPITFKQQNSLDFTNSNNAFWDGRETCEKSRLVMYTGEAELGEELDPLWDSYHDMDWSYGPYAYGDTWTSTLYFYVSTFPWPDNRAYTVQETQYVDTLIPCQGYDTDRAFVYVSVIERCDPSDPNDPVVQRGIGDIHVSVLDNLISVPVNVRMYKNGIQQGGLYPIPAGGKDFNDLEFGFYRFVVVDDLYETWFTDAFPQQIGYDYDLGEVELTAEHNMITYVVNGDNPLTVEDGYNNGDGYLPNYEDSDVGEALEELTDAVRGDTAEGDDSSLAELIAKLLVSLMAGSGLLAIVVLGLPLFLVLGFLLCGLFYLSGGGKK